MNQRVGHWLLPAILAGGLAACALTKPPPDVDPNLFPTGFKKEILDTLSTTLGDPTNVRDTGLSDPVLTPVGNDQRYTACVRYNERDANHHYTGAQDRIAYFYGGHLNQLIVATKEQCGSAVYKPFPELEKLCLGNTCK